MTIAHRLWQTGTKGPGNKGVDGTKVEKQTNKLPKWEEVGRKTGVVVVDL